MYLFRVLFQGFFPSLLFQLLLIVLVVGATPGNKVACYHSHGYTALCQTSLRLSTIRRSEATPQLSLMRDSIQRRTYHPRSTRTIRRHVILGMKKPSDADQESKPKTDNNVQQNPRQTSQDRNPMDLIIDPILTSPYFATFLFWLPFLANDKLRHRIATFLSIYLDLTIAIPTTVICIVFALLYLSYQNRLVDIDLARQTTEQALVRLKEIRSAQISYNDVDPREYQMALENYEYVLRQELDLRYIVPGIKVPNASHDPLDREEDVAAVQMFLGMRITKEGKLEPFKT